MQMYSMYSRSDAEPKYKQTISSITGGARPPMNHNTYR